VENEKNVKNHWGHLNSPTRGVPGASLGAALRDAEKRAASARRRAMDLYKSGLLAALERSRVDSEDADAAADRAGAGSFAGRGGYNGLFFFFFFFFFFCVCFHIFFCGHPKILTPFRRESSTQGPAHAAIDGRGQCARASRAAGDSRRG
jgi:hypothetical protein